MPRDHHLKGTPFTAALGVAAVADLASRRTLDLSGGPPAIRVDAGPSPTRRVPPGRLSSREAACVSSAATARRGEVSWVILREILKEVREAKVRERPGNSETEELYRSLEQGG